MSVIDSMLEMNILLFYMHVQDENCLCEILRKWSSCRFQKYTFRGKPDVPIRKLCTLLYMSYHGLSYVLLIR